VALESKGYDDWLFRQAQEAVLLYVEKFLDKKILFDIQHLLGFFEK